jgi:crossover junction endodeoxyribonuclease RusA
MPIAPIILPWPARALSPNFRSRTHWARTKATKKARDDAYLIARAAGARVPAVESLIAVLLRFEPPTRAARDHDNLLASCKAYLDGIAEAMGVNDSAFRPSIEIGGTLKGGRVIVTVEAP